MTTLGTLAPLLADLGVRSALVLVLATGVVALMHRASAASKHIVWVASCGAVLLLPLASVTLPALPLFVLPPGASIVTSVPAIQLGDHAGSAPRVEAIGENPAGATLRDGAVTGPELVSASRIDWTWRGVVATTWLLGVVAFLARGVAGSIGARRLAVRSRRIDEGPLRTRVDELASHLRVRRQVMILVSIDKAMPVTWGVVRPRILLPAGAERWAEEHPGRLDAVLVHELAHIARLDAAWHLLARLVVALHWFNPLAWFAARQARFDRERACDDTVLAQGVRASQYAGHLLVLAHTLRAPAAALAVLGRSRLDARLKAILDAGTRRRRSPWATAVTVVLAASLWPLAAVQLAARPRAQAVALPARVAVATPAGPLVGNSEPARVWATTLLERPAPDSSAAHSSETTAASGGGQAPVATKTPADFSGVWLPVEPQGAQARFDVGLSDISADGITIVQDARTLRVTRAISPELLARMEQIGTMSSAELTTVYNLDGTPSIRSNRDQNEATVVTWEGAKLYASTASAEFAAWRAYYFDGQELIVESTVTRSGRTSNTIVTRFKRKTTDAAKPRANFSGTWRADANANAPLLQKGLIAPLDNQRVLTIVQDEKWLTITESGPGMKPSTAVYDVDGPSVTFLPPLLFHGASEGPWLKLPRLAVRSADDPITWIYQMDRAQLRVETVHDPGLVKPLFFNTSSNLPELPTTTPFYYVRAR
jgi:beta-lactamase regulating signal transducer with metallopeptidase domain